MGSTQEQKKDVGSRGAGESRSNRKPQMGWLKRRFGGVERRRKGSGYRRMGELLAGRKEDRCPWNVLEAIARD